MIDFKTVISGLQLTMNRMCFNPETGEFKSFHTFNDADKIAYDACLGAIALIKERVPRVLTVDELPSYEGALVEEHRVGTDPDKEATLLPMIWLYQGEDNTIYPGLRFINNRGGTITFPRSNYNRSSRFWTARPNDEQRKGEKWDD